MDWDSFRNCWVKKGTATKVKSEEPVAAATVATVAAELPVSAGGDKKEPESSQDVEEVEEMDYVKPIMNDGDYNKDSNVSPPTKVAQQETEDTQSKTSSIGGEAKEETEETQSKTPAAKDSRTDNFADADEENDSVREKTNNSAPKGSEENAHDFDRHSSSVIEDSNSVMLEETTQAQDSRKTIVVNPEDVNVNDFCYVCRLDGNLMECFAELENGTEVGCGKSIHIGCIGRSQIPSGDWLCSQCAKIQGLPINPGEHPQYGYALRKDEFEIEIGGSVQKLSLGSRIAVFWQDDDLYYSATVVSHNGGTIIEVLYDDDVRESLDLSVEKTKFLPKDGTVIGSSERPKNADEERKIALLGENDIVVGRGDSQTNWARQHGYHEFRKFLQNHHAEYASLSNSDSTNRRALCKKVYSELQSLELRFVSWDGNGWKQLAHSKSVDKINQGLRDFRPGSVPITENRVDERGLRWNDVPLGYSTKKGLAYRPGYQILRRIIVSMQKEFNASHDKRRVCSRVLDQLAKEDVRIVKIVKKEDGDDWVQVQKEKAITRVLRAFREENGLPPQRAIIRPRGLMPSRQISIPPLVSTNRDRDRARHRPGGPPKPAAHLTRYGSRSSANKRSSNVTARSVAWSSPPQSKSKKQKAAKAAKPFKPLKSKVNVINPASQPNHQLSKLSPSVAPEQPPAGANTALLTATGITVPPPAVAMQPLTPAPSGVSRNRVVPHHLDLSAHRKRRKSSPNSPRKNTTPYLGPPKRSKKGKLSAHAAKVLGDEADGSPVRFRNYQVEVWTTRLHEAQEFRKKHGHCIIPHDYAENQELARWAKRQRYQYQLFKNQSGKSYMTKERIHVLEQLGFCWEHKSNVWHQRYCELKEFVKEHGHTLVPTGYNKNRKLATWVKCQRRQMKLREKGKANCMHDDRIKLLNGVQFAWQVNCSESVGSSNRNTSLGESSSEGEDNDGDSDEYDALNVDGIGEEEAKIRAKYKKDANATTTTTASSDGIGKGERKIRAKYKKGDSNATGGIGEEEAKIRAKYKKDDTATTDIITTPEIGEEERSVLAKYKNDQETNRIGEEEAKIRAKYVQYGTKHV
ncbi:MAG: hypothetical protein SGBAC_005202 [Bacillariaceae sp.]